MKKFAKNASFLILFLSGAQRRAEGTVGEAESGIGWVWHDCGTDISQMICTNYTRSSLTKYCSCPPGYAYNTNECKCMPAEICCTNSVSNYIIITIFSEFIYYISRMMCK